MVHPNGWTNAVNTGADPGINYEGKVGWGGGVHKSMNITTKGEGGCNSTM